MLGHSFKRKGLALVTVLLITIPLIMMLTAALSLVGHGTFTSLTYQDRMEAFYAAEAGVVYAIEQLEDQGSSWQPSNLTVDMPNGKSSFELSFSPSVNNLENPLPVAGPRGPDSVPADSADLIVTGKSGSAERTIEVIVQRRGSINIDQAVYASARIHINGNASIVGIKDIYDYTRVDAGIHSNYDVDVADVVRYDGATASMSDGVHGNITAVSEDPGAITITGGGTVFGETLIGEPMRPLKKFDVTGIIDEHSGGSAVPAPDSNGVVALTDGDFYHSGDLTVLGEITLNNSNLYVRGNLDVQGSISGVGSVYVNETTHVRGDSNIRYSSIGEESTGDIDPDEGVGLFSKGDILLEGYDGEQYLEDYVLGGPSSPVRKAWDDSKQSLDLMDDLLEVHKWDGFDSATKDEFDSYRRVLGQDTAFPGAIPSWASGQEQLRVVADAVAAQPSNAEQRFLNKKLNELADNFDAAASFYPGTGMATKRLAVENFLGKGDLRGIVDSSLDVKYDGAVDPLDDAFRIASLQVQQLNLKGMGHSYFQGVVYTEGSLQVKTNLQIVGGILAAGEPTGGTFPGPGDILLDNGTSIIFPRDQFRYGRGVGGTGQLGVSAWIPK